jgi:hypothetical protein
LIGSREAPPKPRYFSSVGWKQDEDPGNLPRWLESIMRQKDDANKRLPPWTTLARSPTIHQQARWDAIQEARGQGLSLRAMAKLLGMSRKTIRRYKAAVSPPVYSLRRAAKAATVSS